MPAGALRRAQSLMQKHCPSILQGQPIVVFCAYPRILSDYSPCAFRTTPLVQIADASFIGHDGSDHSDARLVDALKAHAGRERAVRFFSRSQAVFTARACLTSPVASAHFHIKSPYRPRRDARRCFSPFFRIIRLTNVRPAAGLARPRTFIILPLYPRAIFTATPIYPTARVDESGQYCGVTMLPLVLLSTLSRAYPLPGVIYNVPLLSGGLGLGGPSVP